MILYQRLLRAEVFADLLDTPFAFDDVFLFLFLSPKALSQFDSHFFWFTGRYESPFPAMIVILVK